MKNEVCMVRPFLTKNEEAGIPLNLLILAKVLKNINIDVVIKDYDYLKKIEDKWLKYEDINEAIATDIVATGCSYVLITAMCSNYLQAIDISKKVKELNKNLVIILGGPHSTMCYKETLERYDTIDFISIGEGEETISQLVSALRESRKIDNIKGICYRKNGKVVVNELRPLMEKLDMSPIPDYSIINIRDYYERKGNVALYVGSGCPFNCNFCTTSLVWQRKYRDFS